MDSSMLTVSLGWHNVASLNPIYQYFHISLALGTTAWVGQCAMACSLPMGDDWFFSSCLMVAEVPKFSTFTAKPMAIFGGLSFFLSAADDDSAEELKC